MNINEFLIRQYRFSQEDSVSFLQQHRVLIDGQPAIQRQKLNRRQEVSIDGQIIRAAQEFSYYAYYKPKGIECTLNPKIENNLQTLLPFEERVYPVGRLDKESEGLLLLTDDGQLYQNIALSQRSIEKEYVVTVDRPLSDRMLRQFSEGIVIMGKKTKQAEVEGLDDYTFRIVLTQGLNRQIRRMCHKFGCQVLVLKRIRIASVSLENLTPGTYRRLNSDEIV